MEADLTTSGRGAPHATNPAGPSSPQRARSSETAGRLTDVGSPTCTVDWLALREPADACARATDLPEQHLSAPDGAHTRRVIADLGSGTGSMGRWLAPLLTGAQHWVLHDHDAALLDAAALPETGADGSAVTVETCQGDALAADLDGVDLVTCSALLDMLTADEIDALVAKAVGAGVPALFTLTVTGGARLHPAEPEDPAFAAAFDAHQRRTDGERTLLGPDAGRAAVEAFTKLGATVHTSASPWRIGADSAALLEEWLRGWVGAACEQEPGLLADAEPYLQRRIAALSDGELRAEVGHLDLLALPSVGEE